MPRDAVRPPPAVWRSRVPPRASPHPSPSHALTRRADKPPEQQHPERDVEPLLTAMFALVNNEFGDYTEAGFPPDPDDVEVSPPSAL